jgi:hypothetical protein
MNKPEAILAMKTRSVKITHTNFSPNEWMKMEGDEIVLEDGVVCSELEFWSQRTGLSWWTGYSIFTQ